MEPVGPAVTVVLPTYNECESLKVIVPNIVGTLHEAGIPCEVVVVDDNSPDGTAEIAAQLAASYPLRVIKRTTERGLATAVLAGFAEARAPVCVVMDADGSHPVSALPKMVQMIAQDKADAVVGSRNMAGGGSRNWPLFSQLKSKLAASLTFGLTSMTDPTTGLMAIRKSLLAGLDLDPVGWKIVLEIVVKAAPLRVAEVPIVFEDRELGESKQSLQVFAEYALHVAKLYAHHYPSLTELVKFCVVGLIGLSVDLGTVMLVKELAGLDTRVCALFGFSVAVTTNYFFNRRFTFARGRELPLLWSYLTYVGTNLLGLSVRMATVHGLMVLAGLDRGHGYLVSNAIGIVAATLFNFVGAKYFAFAPERLVVSAAARDDAAPLEPGLAPGFIRGAALLLAAGVAVTAVGARNVGALSVLSLWTTVACIALLSWDPTQRARLYTGLLLACSPAILVYGSSRSSEVTLCALCAAGLYLTTKGARTRRRVLCLLGGALLGLGSLGGLWIAAPYALAACAFVLVQTTLVRASEEQPLTLRRSMLAGMLGFVLASGLRLALAPSLLPTGLAALASVQAQRGSLWFYPVVIYHDHFHLLPLTLFGLPALLRRTRAHAIAALAMAFGACLGTAVFSLLGLNQPRYALAVTPFLYLLAGTSLAELQSDAPMYRPANRATIQAVTTVVLLSVIGLWITRVAAPQMVSTAYALVYTSGMTACAAVGWLWAARNQLGTGMLVACAIALALYAAL